MTERRPSVPARLAPTRQQIAAIAGALRVGTDNPAIKAVLDAAEKCRRGYATIARSCVSLDRSTAGDVRALNRIHALAQQLGTALDALPRKPKAARAFATALPDEDQPANAMTAAPLVFGIGSRAHVAAHRLKQVKASKGRNAEWWVDDFLAELGRIYNKTTGARGKQISRSGESGRRKEGTPTGNRWQFVRACVVLIPPLADLGDYALASRYDAAVTGPRAGAAN